MKYTCRLIDGIREAAGTVSVRDFHDHEAAERFAEDLHNRWAWEEPDAFPMKIEVRRESGESWVYEVERRVVADFRAGLIRVADERLSDEEA